MVNSGSGRGVGALPSETSAAGGSSLIRRACRFIQIARQADLSGLARGGGLDGVGFPGLAKHGPEDVLVGGAGEPGLGGKLAVLVAQRTGEIAQRLDIVGLGVCHDLPPMPVTSAALGSGLIWDWLNDWPEEEAREGTAGKRGIFAPDCRVNERLEGLSPLAIEILLEVGLGDFGFDAGGGDFGFGEPDEGVEDGFAEVVVGPVVVEVSAGEAETASAVGALDGPHHGFGPAAGGDDVGV